MKVLIQESKLKSFIDNQLGYDLSDRIDVIDSWEGAPIDVRYMFPSKESFTKLLNYNGPMYFFHSPEVSKKFLVQHRRNDDGEYYWDIRDYTSYPVDEYDFMNTFGLNLGLSVGQLIKYYVED